MSILEQYLITQIFAVLLVFARVGAGLMIVPGIGEAHVNPRSRLLLALAIAVLMMPVMAPHMPPIPDSPITLGILLLAETIIGAAIGMACRIMVSSMHIAGMLISFQSGLSLATQFDPSQNTQGSLIGNFMSLVAVVVMFSMDLHLVMLRTLSDSYSLFTPGMFPPMEDLTKYYVTLLTDVFDLAFRFSAPSIVVGLLMYMGAGMLARLMPNMQVFFILLPPQIFIAFFLLASVFTAIMLEFAGFYSEHLYQFLEGSF